MAVGELKSSFRRIVYLSYEIQFLTLTDGTKLLDLRLKQWFIEKITSVTINEVIIEIWYDEKEWYS